MIDDPDDYKSIQHCTMRVREWQQCIGAVMPDVRQSTSCTESDAVPVVKYLMCSADRGTVHY